MAKRDPVSAAWDRIEQWLRENAPDTLEALGRGASVAALAAFEKKTGLKLPPAVAASFRRHDGGDEGCGLFPALETDEMAYSPMSLSRAASEWRSSSRFARSYPPEAEFDVDRGIRAECWNAGWIPIATNGGGDYHCVDLSPAPGGKVGQVIEWRHETDERRLVAPSWEARLKELADGLESGRYVNDESRGIVRPRARRKPVAKTPPTGARGAKAAARPRPLSGYDRRLLAAARELGPPVEDSYRKDWEQYGYPKLLKAIDPGLKHFGPCRESQAPAVRTMAGRHPTAVFYFNSAPRGGFAVNGVRLLSIAEMARATLELGVERLTVFAVMDDTGMRFALDDSRIDGMLRTPVVRIPPGVTPPAPKTSDPFKKTNNLHKVLGPAAAAHLADFLRKLASPKHRLGR